MSSGNPFYADLEKAPLGYESASSAIAVHEIDENGLHCGTVHLNKANQQTPRATQIPPKKSEFSSIPITSKRDAFRLFSEIFLPTGYPHSVKPDYIYYQIYDSLQAFSSSIASLFANRAVLGAVGVGDDTATSTSALLMKIVQEAVGRLGTIVFAWKFGSSLEPECKTYRFMADIVNDGATLFDCFSPFFPFSKPLTVTMLCMSGLLRAICGVMGSGSRAALTLHFTQPDRGSVADVNAKDQSQETVISLMGMLAGSAIVGFVEGEGLMMWAMVISLLTLHLYTNYQAVRSVVMRSLNRQRTNIVFADIMDSIDAFNAAGSETYSKMVLGPQKVSQRETILQSGSLLKNSKGKKIGNAEFGDFNVVHEYADRYGVDILELINLTKDHGYVVCYSVDSGYPKVAITLVDSDTTSGSDIRGWAHAYLICNHIDQGEHLSPLEVIKSTEATIEHLFSSINIGDSLASVGWDLSNTMILSHPVKKIKLMES